MSDRRNNSSCTCSEYFIKLAFIISLCDVFDGNSFFEDFKTEFLFTKFDYRLSCDTVKYRTAKLRSNNLAVNNEENVH